MWKDRPIASITRRDAVQLLKGVAGGAQAVKRHDGDKRKGARGGRIAGNRVKSALSGLFNWAIREDLIEMSPIAYVEKPSTERKKTRVLTDREIRLVWRASGELPYPKGPYFRLILATAQRREETATMRWADIHDADDLWMIPPEANKPDRTHAVPLSGLARRVLEQCPQSGNHVFTSRRKRGAMPDEPDADAPLSGYSAAKAELDEITAVLAQKAGEALPDPWTIHDLRRTAATVMGKLGVSRFIQKRVLNHADNDVTGIYDRYEYLPEKRHALELWAGYLERLTDTAPVDPVELAAE